VLVALTRAAAGDGGARRGIAGPGPGTSAASLLDHGDLEVVRGALRLPPVGGPSGRIWRLPPSGWAPEPAVG
jgi:hypothetical protein